MIGTQVPILLSLIEYGFVLYWKKIAENTVYDNQTIAGIHLEERIKIRMLSKLNFEFRSKLIEENMKTGDFFYIRFDGPNYETEDL